MATPNPATVDELVRSAIEAMEFVEASADEVFSATMTLALRTVKAGIAMGADPRNMQKAVEVLLMACADERKKN
jgi:hypothetical protein